MDQIKELREILELLESKQYTVLRQRLSEMNEADIAAILEELEEKNMLKIFRILPKDMAADVFSYMEFDNQQYIITLKDTSILSVIGCGELMRQGQMIVARNFRSFETYAIIAVMYYVVVIFLTKVFQMVERRLANK